ncbi:hypothetical protein D7V86_04465 [bacterium D16-51]|nr:hypothetical protein D7V96_14060 [bacterium D16-59]RKI61777.1 hypothetical protein D7V86_04465 [bacterium D16-51]
MVQYDEEVAERAVSRQDKILEAKSAFGQDVRYAGGYHRNNRVPPAYPDRKETLSDGEERHHFGMLRMVIAGVLFFILVTAFHFQVSYYGFNKENVKKALADESRWNSLVEQAEQVMNTLKSDMEKK